MSDVATGSNPPDDPTTRLASYIKTRRLELGISARQAAETAGIARNTWTGAEEGSRRTAETNYAAIERALRWAPGSINQIKNGGEPAAAEQRAPARNPASAPASDADEALVRIMRSDIPDAEKARIVRLIIAEQEKAKQRMLAMVDELIADTRN